MPHRKPGDGISETLNFKIFWGACPQTPLDVSALGAYQKFYSRAYIFKIPHYAIMSQKKKEGILFSAEIRVVGSYTDHLLSRLRSPLVVLSHFKSLKSTSYICLDL